MGSEATCDYGSADAASAASSTSPQGLIPRFVDDLFAHLQQRQQQRQQEGGGGGQPSEAQVTASFLEIYGEDVFDLLDDADDAAVGRRVSLPIREDAAQGVIVSGLKQVPVASRGEALQVLRKGTTNRCVVRVRVRAVD